VKAGLAFCVLLAVAGCARSGVSGLPASERGDVARVQGYLNGLGPMRARFVQGWPDGGTSMGVLAYEPGRMRLDYAPPHRMEMVAGDGRIVLRDDASQSVTHLALARNPLGLLLRVPVRFDDGIQVTDVRHGPGSLEVSATRADNPSQGLLTLQFSDQGGALTLIGLDGVDARAHHVTLHFTDWQAVTGFPAGTFTPPG